jgi:hypothetical protein
LRSTDTGWIATTVIIAKVTILCTRVKGTLEDSPTRLTGEQVCPIEVVYGQTEGTGIRIGISNYFGVLKQTDRLDE